MKLKVIALALSTTFALGISATASAQISGDVVKIGFITDMSGLYADIEVDIHNRHASIRCLYHV